MVCSFFFVRAAFQFLGRVDSGARGSRTRRVLCPYNSGVFLVHFGVRWCASAVCHESYECFIETCWGAFSRKSSELCEDDDFSLKKIRKPVFERILPCVLARKSLEMVQELD